MDKISLNNWLSTLEKITEYSQSIAERILVNSKQLYKWGVRRELIDSNPLINIEAKADLAITPRSLSRAFSDDEIAIFVWSLNHSNIMRKNKVAAILLLFFGCRTAEIRDAQASDFDLDSGVWEVRSHKTFKKTKRPLYRPIIKEIQPLVEELIEILRSQTIKQGLRALPVSINRFLKKHQGVELESWSMHDLRRTARTNFSTLTQPHIAEIMLGHALPQMFRVYDQHKYLDEQAEAYKAWFDRLTKITKQEPNFDKYRIVTKG